MPRTRPNLNGANAVSSLRKAAFLTLPIVFVFAVWTFYLRPDAVLKAVPRIPFMNANNLTYQDLLPPVPNSHYQAYRLGLLVQKIAGMNESGDVEAALVEAATIISSKKPINLKQLQGVEALLKDIEEQRSTLEQIRGFFNFVNIVWLISILGICVTIVPVAAYLAAPLVSLLVTKLLWIATSIIIPILVKLLPLVEIFAYIFCFALLIQGYRLPADKGFYVALTGAALYIPAIFYSTYLHSTGGGDAELFASVVNLLAFAAWVPIAMLFQSTLIGFLAVVALYGSLGFSVVCTGLCYYVGFKSKDALSRVFLCSLIFIAISVVLKLAHVRRSYIEPFSLGLMTMGCVTYFLAGLIASSKFGYSNNKTRYVLFQVGMIVSLAVFILVGSVFGIDAMFNIACTFAALYGMEKMLELSDNVYVGILLGSICLYSSAMFIHNHPGWIVTMFDSSWIESA